MHLVAALRTVVSDLFSSGDVANIIVSWLCIENPFNPEPLTSFEGDIVYGQPFTSNARNKMSREKCCGSEFDQLYLLRIQRDILYITQNGIHIDMYSCVCTYN